MGDLLDYFSKLLRALDFVEVGALSFSFKFKRILRILKRTDSLPLELRAANLQRVHRFTMGLFIQGAANWKDEIVGVRNFDMSRSREFLSSHDCIILDLNEFKNYKDKSKELRVNFGDVDPPTGGALPSLFSIRRNWHSCFPAGSLASAGSPQVPGLVPAGEIIGPCWAGYANQQGYGVWSSLLLGLALLARCLLSLTPVFSYLCWLLPDQSKVLIIVGRLSPSSLRLFPAYFSHWGKF